MSRSAFVERFTKLMGIPRSDTDLWRLQTAKLHLRETQKHRPVGTFDRLRVRAERSVGRSNGNSDCRPHGGEINSRCSDPSGLEWDGFLIEIGLSADSVHLSRLRGRSTRSIERGGWGKTACQRHPLPMRHPTPTLPRKREGAHFGCCRHSFLISSRSMPLQTQP